MKPIKILLIALACAAIFSGPVLCAELLSVRTSAVNVRSGPGTRYPAQWKAWKFTPLLVLERKGAWVHVRDFENVRGWVSAGTLVKTPTVTVKSAAARVRAAPKASSEVLWEVDREYSFKVLGKRKGWVHVSDDEGTEGWIAASLLWGAI
ncbi:MAG: SH3 domain-containing protein [Elusimicrobiaceae bacterium]|nr:SH3 domain-containing protein [Elusimicrobiaceae bacterium]